MIETCPPHDNDLEKTVLGTMLLDKSACEKVLLIIDEKCFYNDEHQTLYKAINNVVNRGDMIQQPIIISEIKRITSDDMSGAELIIDECMEKAVLPAAINNVCEQLIDVKKRRELHAISMRLINETTEPGCDINELLDQCQDDIYQITEDKDRKGPVHIDSIAPKFIEKVEEAQKNGESIGLKTGFYKLDRYTTGFHPGDLILIAGRPGMGKTAFAMSIAMDCAMRPLPCPSLVFSLEMPAMQLYQRLVSSQAEIDGLRIGSGELTKKEMMKMSDGMGKLYQKDIFIDDTPGVTANYIRGIAKRYKKKHGIGLVVIDYIQLMGVTSKHGNRSLEIGSISKSLKETAKMLEIPIILLSQLNRACELRPDKKPQASDLRESGSLEQDADTIIFPFRPIKYQNHETNLYTEYKENDVIIILEKQRRGPADLEITNEVQFEPIYTRFSNLAKNIPDNEYEDVYRG